jgi:outer membrane protein assembly factor BamB
MGQFCSTCAASDTQIVQEIPQGAGRQSGSPVYWNNRVYFTGVASPVQAYTISNGTLVVPPFLEPIQINGGGHAILTANGASNGILWFINGKQLWALDAITLKTLYTSDQAASGRDTVPPLAHFATPIAADGKVFIGTQNSLVVYGLFNTLPDLSETIVTDPPATIVDGSSFSVTDTVQNNGSSAAAASTTRYYLSTTGSKGGARLLTGSRAAPSLAPNATSTGTVTVTVSAGTAAGTYFLLACADDTVLIPESNESNNCKASAALTTH